MTSNLMGGDTRIGTREPHGICQADSSSSGFSFSSSFARMIQSETYTLIHLPLKLYYRVAVFSADGREEERRHGANMEQAVG
eukprot:6198068-Pleurochrysis_carterae.AAC.1